MSLISGPKLTAIILGYLVVILVLHTVPIGALGGTNEGWGVIDLDVFRPDYLLHLLLFMPWGFYCGSRFVDSPRTSFAWLLPGLILAVASEGLQYWLPYRSFSWIDASLNTLGILFGYAIFATVRPLRDLFFRTFRSSS